MHLVPVSPRTKPMRGDTVEEAFSSSASLWEPGKYWPDSYGMPELPKDAPTKALTKANLKRHARMPYHRLARVRSHVWEAARDPRVAFLNQTWAPSSNTHLVHIFRMIMCTRLEQEISCSGKVVADNDRLGLNRPVRGF